MPTARISAVLKQGRNKIGIFELDPDHTPSFYRRICDNKTRSSMERDRSVLGVCDGEEHDECEEIEHV